MMTTIQLLGVKNKKFCQIRQQIDQVVRQIGPSVNVEEISDIDRILTYNPTGIPALAVDGKVLAAYTGLTPSQSEVFHLINRHLSSLSL